MCEFKFLVLYLFSSLCISGVYTMKHHFLDRLAGDFRRFGYKSVLDASDYEKFNTRIKKS